MEAYVRQPDSFYSWKRTEQTKVQGVTATHLELVSQLWRGQFWSHHLQVVCPAEVRHPDMALLWITGDGDGRNQFESLKVLAQRSGSLVAILTQVPNQPLYDGRHEDALIAFTFNEYLKGGDDTWPLLFPMVKSAVRAMDTLQAFAEQEYQQPLKQFVVTGASKRGWTTWLTGAIDPRVKAIAPMVIDMLNMKAQTQWSQKVYGRQSEQISDYTELNLIERMDDPRMVTLRGWVDPYSYRSRYRLPKLLLLGSNDPYWTVDALRHYWSDLPESKLVFQTPNAGHDLAGGKEALQTLAAWFQMIADRQELPRLGWQLQNPAAGPASLTVTLNRAPKAARLWTADSPDRDFRNDRWTSQDLPLASGSMEVAAKVERPAQGYRAFLVEAVLVSPTGHEYKLSTEARVTPDTVP